ncbi:MAG: crosslink repair DNA glycosylase YcaQ family protein, partial [Pseudomonadota bacterium]
SLPSLPEPSTRVRLLSPFDPALRDRQRAERLFGFEYRIEIFVPEAKRRYGYYVFPVMEGERVIGRLDAKRVGNAIAVRAFWPEAGCAMGRARTLRLSAELDRLKHLAGAKDVTFATDWLQT